MSINDILKTLEDLNILQSLIDSMPRRMDAHFMSFDEDVDDEISNWRTVSMREVF